MTAPAGPDGGRRPRRAGRADGHGPVAFRPRSGVVVGHASRDGRPNRR
ncbi:hypothetical protein Ae406Ps2_4782 [Pseudonocardia sp. Ae406_Ps2]|nr:hypothetical protein Ae331Ps2_1172c [Pseudonocardia sp. Ae331_Ps2]OLM04782.1 hypothetical protein Ae406Ps2_4782 [Pseudonocardia sp. Ae406_Ps2]OLM10393.1 hypothetical protein Ae505Ps2_0516c [Pseudonocardia sp. Ae505_Ps2]OLM26350.1 hypothetical protein Ae706Ps2_4783 [Pseudonocardia sp. Ae706_Ps2]